MLLLIFLNFALSTFRDDHALSISFTAPWSPVRLVDQMLSFFIHYSNDVARDFLFNITSNGGERMNDTEYLWEAARNILPSQHFPILKANIDFGATIPRSIFNGFYSHPYTKDINLTESNKYEAFQTDFISYGKSHDLDESYKNIIYTDIIKDADRIHDLLKKEAPFVLRSTPVSTGNQSKVRGYGIELRPFKYSMEYNVKNREEHNNDAQEKINIIDKTTLHLPNEFEENISSISFKDIEARFANYLKEHSSNDNYTALLRDIASNWPLYLKAINDSDVDHQSISDIQKFFDPLFRVSYLNGRYFSINSLDSFQLLQIIDEERTFTDILSLYFNSSHSNIDWFVSNPLIDQKMHFFDFRTDLINYYNDIEKDSRYTNWPEDIKLLANYRRILPRVKKNVIHSILYFDPTTIEGMNQFFTLVFVTMNMYPITAGIIPIFRMNDQLSRKVAFAYHHLTLHNPRDGINFLLKSYNYIQKDQDTRQLVSINEESFARAFDEVKSNKKNRKKWSKIHDLFTPDSDEYKSIQKVANYYETRNIEVGTVCVDGIIHEAPINANAYFDIIYRTFSTIVPILRDLKDDEGAMKNHIIDSIKKGSLYPVIEKVGKKIFTDEIESIDLHTFRHDDQIRFIEELDEIEWYNEEKSNANDEKPSVNTYAIILTGSTFNESGYDTLDKFLQSKTKSEILFSIDPSIEFLRTKVLNSIPAANYPLLIINGRLIKNFNYSDISEYEKVDEWNFDYVIQNYPVLLKLKMANKIDSNRHRLLKFYLSSISNSWRANSIRRGYVTTFMVNDQNPLKFTKTVKDALELTLVIDPFDRIFQRMIGIFDYLNTNDVLSFNMILNPSFSESDDLQTLSSFYRSSTDSDNVTFSHLNDRTTYSSMIDVPNSWQAESLRSAFDLDNILLSELAPSVHTAEYVLTNIIVEGSCVTEDDYPASGSSLSISPPINELASKYYRDNYACKSDTIVMEPQNGYFQLMGTIGPNIISYKNKFDNIKKFDVKFDVDNFALKKLKIILKNVKRKELKKQLNYLNKQERSSYKNSSRIDVFGVASGHLYERLIKIMMLSVKRHTEPKTIVTFWLLNNFLSPQFKSALPQMAAKYQFKYKLVKYKWPKWIYPQLEKQRIIWGNKILFLDVLFPLNLERVIYIDSDQIVRTDMKELMQMDFNEAPYAFTPFCDSRVETEPYRFWKKGFWKEQLQEMAYAKQKQRDKNKKVQPLKYHISALFAIDLLKFRQMNGGDILRKFYQSLAPDKNSLANLDQDLPNFVQSELPIFSLPQEWLWCETWCSDETMSKAKTIDLCNNPLTKKPKLEIAQTRITEWPGLDKEVSAIKAPSDEYEKMFFN